MKSSHKYSFSLMNWPLAAIVIILVLAFLPVSSFVFAIKNDFFFGYYPVKHFLTQCLRAGEFPLWNPFLNYGFPAFGDMSLSYWNPITWLFALSGYNAYSFTAEELLYILAAGVGMYGYMGIWTKEKAIRLSGSVSYMCSGFMVGHLQHFNWISAAGLLPWVMWALHRHVTLENGKTIFPLVISAGLFITGSHPGMIIGLALLALPYLCWLWFNTELTGAVFIRKIAWMILLLLLSQAGTLWSYGNVIPFTNRGTPVSRDMMTEGFTDAGSWLSFLMPLAVQVKKGVTQTDPALRNVYLGILLLPLMASLWIKPPVGVQRFMLAAFVLFLWLASPYFLPSQHQVPLINFVRLPGEFRLFALFCGAVLTTVQLERMMANRTAWRQLIRITALLIFLFMAFTVLIRGKEIRIYFESMPPFDFSVAVIKEYVNALPFSLAVLIQGLFACGMLTLLQAGVDLKKICLLISADMIISTLICLPFTGVGTNTLHGVQQLLNKAPKGLQTQSMLPEEQLIADYPATEKLIGSWSHYSKQVGMPSPIYYPLTLHQTQQYFQHHQQELLREPFAFSRHKGGNWSIASNTHQSFSILGKVSLKDTLVIKQVNFPGWRVSVDGVNKPLLRTYHALCSVELEPGNHAVTFRYRRPDIFYSWIVQQLILVTLVIFAVVTASDTFSRSRS